MSPSATSALLAGRSPRTVTTWPCSSFGTMYLTKAIEMGWFLVSPRDRIKRLAYKTSRRPLLGNGAIRAALRRGPVGVPARTVRSCTITSRFLAYFRGAAEKEALRIRWARLWTSNRKTVIDRRGGGADGLFKKRRANGRLISNPALRKSSPRMLGSVAIRHVRFTFPMSAAGTPRHPGQDVSGVRSGSPRKCGGPWIASDCLQRT
jgi:hypothetical protein